MALPDVVDEGWNEDGLAARDWVGRSAAYSHAGDRKKLLGYFLAFAALEHAGLWTSFCLMA